MDPKEQSSAAKDVNIDINGEPDNADAVKSMRADENDQRVGLSKEELMKYANEPFWIRLRNILFAAFWFVWLSILVAAIGYVIHSPGCKLASAASVKATATAGSLR